MSNMTYLHVPKGSRNSNTAAHLTSTSRGKNFSHLDLATLGEKPVSFDEDMWRAVVLQAFVDATWVDPRPNTPITNKNNDVGRRNALTACAQARAWLRGTSKDFFDVCVMAGMEPAWVRSFGARCEAAGWPSVRRADGESSES